MYLIDRNNLIFDTLIETWWTNYKPYFLAHHQTLGNYIVFTKISDETRWFKFLLNSIPLDSFIDNIAGSLEANYPKINLVQTLY